MHQIIPAILSEDKAELEAELSKLNGLTDWLQIDVADGLFVSTRTVEVLDLVGFHFKSYLEFHLMTLHPEKYIADCQAVGAKRIVFQLEAVNNPTDLLNQIKSMGMEAGLALKPETPIEKVIPYLNFVDVVLLLTVSPGKQGQALKPNVLQKISALRKIDQRLKIEVDGGINLNNVVSVVSAGADYLVVGSAILQSNDIPRMIDKFLAKI
ncbi:MAG: ribulose-phosphate 3-epimerase [Candidatus Buchananbacteria bacterium]|nr:ribulose-phosphate 3-epimerase [Candidatus Buchananbacteria bacterium]